MSLESLELGSRQSQGGLNLRVVQVSVSVSVPETGVNWRKRGPVRRNW